MKTFQEILRELSHFWEQQGCLIHQGYDLEIGAGTFNPATFLRCLGPEPYNAAYIEPSRRPTDGRYGTNPNRLQHYFQYQVMLKPAPLNILDLYLQSLEKIGFNLNDHDIRFVHDDWEAPTLGAWGLGWEIWMDGMEVTQFTYFQAVAGVEMKPVTGEITYGIERLAMYLQKVNSIFDLKWNENFTYGDIYLRNEIEWSHYNFEEANTEMWFRHFDDFEKEARQLLKKGYPIPAYDFVMKGSHAFNILDARGVISVSERTGYISRIRDLAHQVAASYVASREKLGFPLVKKKVVEAPAPLPALAKTLSSPTAGAKDDFLLEIGSEELPATFVPIGMQGLEKGIRNFLTTQGVSFGQIQTFGTPRRLAVIVKDLALEKPSQTTERKGPSLEQAFDKTGKPTPAGEGFFRSAGLASMSLAEARDSKQIEVRNLKGVDYLFAFIHTSGQPTANLLAEGLPKIIFSIDFPKKMRWADLDVTYARPLQWVVAMIGSEIIPFRLANLASGHTSQGHRQLSPQPFTIPHVKEYLAEAKKHYVMADPKEREKAIEAQIETLEKEQQGKIVAKERVMPQVIHLVEWPTLTMANFNADFLKTPKEVLISEMVEHQKYFPFADLNGELKNLFVITSNTHPTDQIRAGNQKVLSARLKDGVFLYEQDIKIPLEAFNTKLKNVIFLKGLGSVYNKVERLRKHVQVLNQFLPISNEKQLIRAAELCKADLASHMVYEFPELQGIMGKYYALAHQESKDVAEAIDEHWMPRGENAPLPENPCGIILSIAEKIDNLLSCYAMDLKPTSSSDPYALRRQVLGLIKILIKGKFRMPLPVILEHCWQAFPAQLQSKKEILEDIKNFIAQRIRTVFLDYGFSKDEIEASLAAGFSDIYDTFSRVEALHEFRASSPQFPLLYEVYRRAKGQLDSQAAGQFSAALLIEQPEKDLDQLLNGLEVQFQQSLKEHSYDKAYLLVSQLQPALAGLFDRVKILADDPKLRNNRLALLQRVFGLFNQLLDFSKIQS